MIAFGPEQGVVDEEADDLAAAEVVDQRVPVGMEAEARVFVFVERCAVKTDEAVLVRREVGRDPVDKDGNARPVGAIDETGEPLDRKSVV